MKITLTKDLEKFVSAKVRSGGYTDASEVVREALRTFRSDDDPAETDSQELADLLLPAVRSKHRPLTAQQNSNNFVNAPAASLLGSSTYP